MGRSKQPAPEAEAAASKQASDLVDNALSKSEGSSVNSKKPEHPTPLTESEKLGHPRLCMDKDEPMAVLSETGGDKPEQAIPNAERAEP